MEKPLLLQILFGVIALLSFGGNGLFCFVITRHHRLLLRSPYHILIFSLAVTDMLTGKLTVYIIIDLARANRVLSRIYHLGEKSLVAEGDKPLRRVPHPKLF